MPFAQRPDARIWWDQDGTGDPILLIMGHAYGADMWYRTAPELAASYRVIRFDNRGAGRSSDPPGPYPMRLMAEDALAVLDAAGAASAHVYGVSLGGAIALQLALDHPGRVRSLILGCTAASARRCVSWRTAHPDPVPAARRRPQPDGRKAAVRAGHAGRPPGRRPADRPAYPVQRTGTPRPDHRRRGLRRHRPAAEIRVPTLVMHGARDRIVPAANAQRLADGIAGARLVMFPDAGRADTPMSPRPPTRRSCTPRRLPGARGSSTGARPAASTVDT